jgi:MSHA biogenesis protein MshQ
MRRLSVVILASSVLVLAGEAKAALVAEYRFEESLWNGTPGEVKDSSGNGRHATAVQVGGGVRPGVVAGGKVCRGAQISHNTSKADISAIATPVAIPTTVGNAGTIMFWYNNSANTPNNDRVLFDATTADSPFYLKRTSRGALSFTVTDFINVSFTATTSDMVLPNTGWSHIAVSWNFFVVYLRVRIWVNGALQKTSLFITLPNVSTQIGTLYIGDNRSANSIDGDSAGNPGGTAATIDEFSIYNHEADSALINQHMNQTRVCHYAISHAGTGPACQANNVTVAAHDAAHNPVTLTGKTITLSTSTGQGDWTLVSGSGTFNNGTPNDGAATYTWNGESQAVFALSHPTPGVVNINVSDGAVTEDATEDPSLNLASCVTAAKFNACHNYTSSHCSAATGRLYTRLAGVPSDYDIVALDNSGNVATTFTGKAQVSLIARANPGAVDAQNCFSPDYTQVLDNAVTNFTAGRLTLTNKIVPNAYREARIKVECDATNCPPSGITWCSVDNFAIRPQTFTVTASASVNNPPTSKLAAGNDFTLTAASGTSTYDGAPTVDAALVRDHNNNAIDPGSLVGTFPPASGGSSTGTFQYHDVGTISLLADAVKDATYTSVDGSTGCVAGSTSNTLSVDNKYGCVIGSVAAGPFGRFHPHHFTYTATLTPGCGSGGFTYMGEPALEIDLILEAKSANGTTTTRYTSGYSPLGTFSITGDNGGTPVNLTGRLALPAFVWNNGAYNGSGTYTFNRQASPDGPFDSFALKATVSDPDGATLSGSNLSDTTKLRFGRLVLSNAHGSELLSLVMPFQTQYWTGSAWATNTLDSCTDLTGQFVFVKNPAGMPTPTGGIVTSGKGSLTFSAPGTKGTVDVCANIGSDGDNPMTTCRTGSSHPWLQGSWDADGQYNDNPSARATFGIFEQKPPVIYRRERY